MPLLLAGAAALLAGGFFFDKAGEGINDAGTGIIKVAIAGGVGYFALKKLKVM